MKPFCYTTEVRFRDLDANGHLNNAVFLTFLEQARIRWWETHLQGRPWKEHFFLIARTEIDYRKPVLFHDTIRVELTVSRIGTSSFTLAFAFHRVEDDMVVAEGQSVQVTMDTRADRSCPIPPETRAWLEAQA